MADSSRGLIWGLSSDGKGITTSSWSHTWKALVWDRDRAAGRRVGLMLDMSSFSSSSSLGPSTQSIMRDKEIKLKCYFIVNKDFHQECKILRTHTCVDIQVLC